MDLLSIEETTSHVARDLPTLPASFLQSLLYPFHDILLTPEPMRRMFPFWEQAKPDQNRYLIALNAAQGDDFGEAN